jgi:micrococcal nuclease
MLQGAIVFSVLGIVVTLRSMASVLCGLRFHRLMPALCLVPCLVLLMGCQSVDVPQGDLVKVSRVVSGQTVEVVSPATRGATPERVRLIGVDAPAWKQEPWYSDAKTHLETLLGNEKTVLLESDLETAIAMQDGSKVRLAYLWKDHGLLNEQMVQAGRVLAATRSPNLKYDQRLTRAQEQARLSGLGIWNPDRPMRQTPQEFRQQNQKN